MDPLPLFALPPAALTEFYLSLEYAHLFLIAQCSERAKQFVKTMSLMREPYVSVELNAKPTCVQLNFDELLSWDVLWNFYEKRDTKRISRTDLTPCHCDGIELEFFDEQVDEGFTYGCSTICSEREVIQFAKYVMDLFNAKIQIVEVNIDDDVLDHVWESGILKDAEKVEFKSEQRASHVEVMQILELTDRPSVLSLESHVQRGFVVDKIVSGTHLKVHGLSWLNGRNLSKLHFENLEVLGSQLTNLDLHDFLFSWMLGSHRNLSHLVVRQEIFENQFELPVIIRGIPMCLGSIKPWKLIELKGPMLRCFTRIPYEYGFDLRRYSDGRIASVLHIAMCNNSIFVFTVW